MTDINFENCSQEYLIEQIKALREKSAKLEDENLTLKKTVEKQNIIMKNMNEMLVKGKKKMFGKSSEQLKYMDGSEQLMLFNEAEKEYNAGSTEPKAEEVVRSYSRRPKRTKEELTENLVHKEVTVELENTKCPECGAELVVIGREKLHSELSIVPAQIFVVDYYRSVYKCAECEKATDAAKIIKPDAPVPVMKKSMASAATVAYVMQEKYQNGVPLFRQEQYWKSNGVELNRNTLANWIIRSSVWFKPLWTLMRKELLSEDIIHADETELRVLKRDGKATDSMSRMWIFCSGKFSQKPMSLYKYHATRSGKVVEDILGGYGGYLQTDGYAAYNAAFNAVRVGCWAHARRKFVDCLPKGIDSADAKSKQALAMVEKIFAIEKGLAGMPSNQIYEARLRETKPILDSYWDLLGGIDACGGSGLSKAAAYSIHNKKELECIMLDGRLELTNNRAERAVKPFVIGRKNWLFSDTDRGADASALIYSIIESAKLNKLDVYGYLLYLLTELPKLGKDPNEDKLQDYLPWKKMPDYCYTK